MTGLPYPRLDAERRSVYERFPINLTRMMLHTRDLTVPYWDYALRFRNAAISARVREQVIVRVAAATDCEYQLVQHIPEALRTGTSERLLAALTDPRCTEFDDPALTALVVYIDSLVKNIGAEQETLDTLRRHFPDNHVAEITLLAATYILCAAFLKSLQVPLDDGPVDWAAIDARSTGSASDGQ
ncbi:carboxymuconolactone decarboxylase family protein [Mycobacterium seoulense]|uniref:carboxymuconolactone decarboxylase family protein n=1 Tax=Mycobacterium seoulense TaxID=386911 RepID=UPI003CE94061